MPRLVFTGKEFVYRTDFANRKKASEAGFVFDERTKTWRTDSLRVAARLRRYADASAKKIIDAKLIRIRPWRGPLLVPKGLTLKDFQSATAVPFILSRNRSYPALQAGLGKTVCAAVARNTLDQPAVYISPPFLARNVEYEFTKWSTSRPRIWRLDPLKPLPEGIEILIVPDSLIARPEIRKIVKEFAETAIALGMKPILYIDEAHRFKNMKAGRTKSLMGARGTQGLRTHFARRVWLSGTPMPNRPIELYPILSREAPETIDFMTESEYGFEYCAGRVAEEECQKCGGVGKVYRANKLTSCRYCKGSGGFSNGYDFTGASNLERLRKNVHGTFMLRLKKADVLKELPPKTEEIVIIGEAPPRLIAMESQLLKKTSPVDLMEGKIGANNLATYLRLLGEVKVKPAVDFIRSLLEDSDESFLIYGYHKKVIEGLVSGLNKFEPLVITGDAPNAERDKRVKAFQTRKLRGLMVGNYQAMGIGYTLTRASRIIFVEWGWVPEGENDQAIDRAHRIGQTRVVHSQYLVFENSIDARKMEANFRKRKVTGYI